MEFSFRTDRESPPSLGTLDAFPISSGARTKIPAENADADFLDGAKRREKIDSFSCIYSAGVRERARVPLITRLISRHPKLIGILI